MDKKKIATLVKAIEKKFGKGSIYTLGSKYANAEIPRVPSGIQDLDDIIGGGIPQGRLIELFGANSAGKTSLAYHLMAQYPFGLFLDMEGTFDEERARVFGCNKDQIAIHRPTWAEQALAALLEFAEAGCPIIVLDSVGAMISRKEYEEEDMHKQAGVGMLAGLLSRKLPKLINLCEKTGTTVVFINQVRDKIGGFAWGDPYVTPGGHALKHLVSLRVQVARKQWILYSKEKVGQITKVRIIKSKVSRPQGECEIPLLFECGFVKHEEVKSTMREIAKARKEARKEGSKDGEMASEANKRDTGQKQNQKKEPKQE